MLAQPGPVWPKRNPVLTGLKCRCPRCGEGRLFDGFLTLAKACGICGLAFDFADSGDGPAFFIVCFGCIPVVAFALILQFDADPPWWVHLLTTLPLCLITCILPMRPLKGWLVCSQYFYRAGEGRLARDRSAPTKEKSG